MVGENMGKRLQGRGDGDIGSGVRWAEFGVRPP